MSKTNKRFSTGIIFSGNINVMRFSQGKASQQTLGRKKVGRVSLSLKPLATGRALNLSLTPICSPKPQAAPSGRSALPRFTFW